jgi:LacI family transcriptional regulator
MLEALNAADCMHAGVFMSQTIRDIARKAKVSVATVSRVLNNNGYVKEKTREKVMRIVQKNDFVLNQSAKNLKERKTYTIGIISSNLLSSYNVEVIKGIEAAAAESEYRTVICDCNNIHNKLRDEQERHYIKILGGSSVDGIILLHTHLSIRDFEYYKKRKIKLSVLGVNLASVGYPSITVDSVYGAYQAVKHLGSHGHRKIGFIYGIQRNAAKFNRVVGYRKALAELKIKENSDYLADGEFSIEGGARAFRRLMELKNPPKAVFCANDDMALGAMKTARKMGIRIPGDVALVGYDDILTCELTNPQLTSVHQTKNEIGKLLFDRLIESIQNKSDKKKVFKNIILTPELVIRESCGCSLPGKDMIATTHM